MFFTLLIGPIYSMLCYDNACAATHFIISQAVLRYCSPFILNGPQRQKNKTKKNKRSTLQPPFVYCSAL